MYKTLNVKRNTSFNTFYYEHPNKNNLGRVRPFKDTVQIITGIACDKIYEYLNCFCENLQYKNLTVFYIVKKYMLFFIAKFKNATRPSILK